jgi:hypothetical protein
MNDALTKESPLVAVADGLFIADIGPTLQTTKTINKK